MLITTKEAFGEFLQRAASSSVLAIDTEFLREKTFYSKLCLLQLATDDEVAIVDPFTVYDLDILKPILLDPGVVKVFHAASQDLEIIFREFGILPTPIFDTQIAATLLGYSQQVGYAALASSMCEVTLKKSDSYTDWSRRPLADSQLEYAADDVLYLPRIYHAMVEELTKRGRLNWLDEDFSQLSDPSRFDDDPMLRYRKLKRVSHLSRQQLSAARELAAWRELEAQKRNIPRKWVLSDEQVVEACRKEAKTLDELFLVRGIKDHLSMRDARNVAAAIKRGLEADPSTFPQADSSSRKEVNVDSAVDLMSAIARVRAKESGVAQQTLAPHGELVKLARGYIDDCELAHGWRRALLGDELMDLLAGKLALSLSDTQLRVSAVPNGGRGHDVEVNE